MERSYHAARAMSRKGCSPDNAACEGFFGRLKTEMFFARDWLSTAIEDFVAALDAYIRWYNEVRIKSSLGFRSPAEHRRSLGLAAKPVQAFFRTPAPSPYRVGRVRRSAGRLP